MRVIITASRDWTRKYPIASAIDLLADAHGDELTIVHGDCRDGGDAIAHSYATMRQVKVETFPVTRDEWAAFGRAAGPKRNQRMVDAGADLCLAFIMPCVSARCRTVVPHGSHGASGCAAMAVTAGIKTEIEQG